MAVPARAGYVALGGRGLEPVPLIREADMRTVLKWIGIVVLALVALRVVAAFIWPTINDVETGATPQYADLQPQRFAAPRDRVFDNALATARDLGWEVTGDDRGAGVIRAVATTRVFRFKDDVTVTVRTEGDGTTVGVRSKSRIGKGDLGANARRIRAFQAELARRTAGGPAH
jgi:uncharacterized protein (DUF1499 family)